MPGAKRGRTDGHVRREDFEASDAWADVSNERTSLKDEGVVGFPRASATTLATRPRVKRPEVLSRAQDPARVRLFKKAVRLLNQQFSRMMEQELAECPDADLSDAVQDYLSYAYLLEDRFLRSPGVVMTWGDNDCNQLGYDRDGKLDARPRVVRALRNISATQIACGSLHSVLLTDSGRLWTWGVNDDGALGRPGPQDVPTLVGAAAVEGLRFLQVAAGDCHSVALTTAGDVYAWGCFKDDNNKSCGGVVAAAKACMRNQTEPVRVPGVYGAMEVRCGFSSALALLSDATVVSWGLGGHGELGRPVGPLQDAEERPNFASILNEHLLPSGMTFAADGEKGSGGTTSGGDGGSNSVTDVRNIAAGGRHAFVVRGVYSAVYGTGLNNYGQVGLGAAAAGANCFAPALTHVAALDNLGVASAACGEFHSLFLTADGRLLACGRSDAGQLGVGAAGETLKPGSFLTAPVEVALPGAAGVPTAVAAGGSHS
ncbi:unnamed protein product, partial [Phaeothamnion confervicola]